MSDFRRIDKPILPSERQAFLLREMVGVVPFGAINLQRAGFLCQGQARVMINHWLCQKWIEQVPDLAWQFKLTDLGKEVIKQ
ncbi:hypothetical protein K6Y31_20825 [Motilimonas cestriensis]|uniref:Uncharacterized protein n=1 Tax=Motilimonas cestriensis TaxID=2742685 RepID=A0ABS8WG98_9GAMM|nr:hypothetical protein [Motilimonas cestriensis]MCE2597222.1 hypothetical protein [Motilimonas cestriensis]